MSANPIHNKILRYVQRQVKDAIARRDNYAKQLLNVENEFNEQGEETITAKEKRAEIESNLREIEEYLFRVDEYKTFPTNNLATTFCPHCFLSRGDKDTSLDLTDNSKYEIHCVVCNHVIE